jgi:hypothetical protein
LPGEFPGKLHDQILEMRQNQHASLLNSVSCECRQDHAFAGASGQGDGEPVLALVQTLLDMTKGEILIGP